MKKSINAWSVNAETGFAEMFAQIKEAGFDGIELNVDRAGNSRHSLTMDTTADELAEIAAISKKEELPVVSISTGLYGGKMGSACAEEREFTKKVLEKQLFCAKALGADGILAVPGGDNEASLADAYKYSEIMLAESKAMIDSYGIAVGLENVWNGFFMSPFDMTAMIDRLDNANIGAYFDVGNVLAFSWPECWIPVLGKSIKKIHIKDYKRNGGRNMGGTWEQLLDGDCNWAKVIPALRDAGFDGYLTAEVPIPRSMSNFGFYKSVAWQIGKILEF